MGKAKLRLDLGRAWGGAVRRLLSQARRLYSARRQGGVAEWFKAHAWKACSRETVSWVRIPSPPPPSLVRTGAFSTVWRMSRQIRRLAGGKRTLCRCPGPKLEGSGVNERGLLRAYGARSSLGPDTLSIEIARTPMDSACNADALRSRLLRDVRPVYEFGVIIRVLGQGRGAAGPSHAAGRQIDDRARGRAVGVRPRSFRRYRAPGIRAAGCGRRTARSGQVGGVGKLVHRRGFACE